MTRLRSQLGRRRAVVALFAATMFLGVGSAALAALAGLGESGATSRAAAPSAADLGSTLDMGPAESRAVTPLPPVDPDDIPGTVGGVVEAVVGTVDGVVDTVVGLLPFPPGDPEALPDDVQDLLTYRIRTVYRGASGDVEAVNPSVLLVPTPVNVDNDVTTGAGGNEIVVQLTVDAGRATLRVSKLPNTPADLPLLVEAIIADPRHNGSGLEVAFGYDTLTSKSPSAYDATVALLGAGRTTSFALDLHTVDAGDTLGVLAEIYTPGEEGTRIDPVRGRVDFSPVPTAAHFGGIQGSDLGIQQSGVDLVTDIPTKAEVLLEDLQGSSRVAVAATVDKVPNTLSLLLADSDTGRRSWSYRATDRVDLIDLRITETHAGDVGDDFNLHLEDMSLTANLVQDTPTHATLTTDSAIGILQAGLATGGEVEFLDDPAYIYNTHHDGVDSLALRLLGLSRLEATTADPFVFDAALRAGPFRVLLVDGSRRVDARVIDLPSEVRLEYAQAGNTVDLETNARIGQIVVDASDPTGLVGRATDLDLSLLDVPEDLTFSFQNAGTAGVDAHGGTIGQVDLLLTSGPQVAIDDGFEGFVLEDVADHYALVVHLLDLKKAEVSTGEPPYEVTVNSRSMPFLARLVEGDRNAEIKVLDIPSEFTATYNPAGSIAYTASAPIGRIDALITDPSGVAGRATSAEVHLVDVPAALEIGYDTTGGDVLVDAQGATVGAVDVLLTSGPDLAVDAGFTGVVLEDVADHYAAAIHLVGLKLARATTSPPYELTVNATPSPFVARLTQGDRFTEIKVLDIPSEFSATYDPVGAVTYTASGAIGEISARISDPAGVGGRATRAEVLLRDLPAALDIGWNTAGAAVGVDAKGAQVGLIDVLLTSGPDLAVDAGFTGVVLEDVADHYAAAVHLVGLRKAEATTTAPYRLLIDQTPSPFVVRLSQGDRFTELEVLDLPATFDATYDPAGSISYTAGGTIGEINALITDPGGVGNGATRATAHLAGLPEALDVSWNTAGGAVGVDGHGQTLGLIEFQLTSGPDLAVDAGFDGFVLEDVATHYAAAARLHGLTLAQVSTGAAPYTIDLRKQPGPFLVRLTQSARFTEFTIQDLPSSLQATFNPAGSISYSASSTIAMIRAEISDPAGVGGRATRAKALLQSVPASLTLDWGSTPGQVTADAKGATVGLLDVLLTSGPVLAVPADRDGVIVRDLIASYTVAAKLSNLKKAVFAQGPPPSITLDTTGGRLFQLDMQTQKQAGTATTNALINVLPASMAVNFSGPTTFSYRASGAVSSITLDAFDPAGISGRANTLHALLSAVPVALDVSTAANGTITADALGGTVGLLEFQLTSGPNDRIATGFDGLLLNDLTDRYVMFARIGGLKKAVGATSPAPNLNLQTTASRPFKIDLNRWNGTKVEYNRATLLNLPASVQLSIAGQNISYTASGTASSLSFDTNVGNRWNMHADIANPVPASFSVCQAQDISCTPSADRGGRSSANAGSVRFVASEHTTVNMFDCVSPANSTCPTAADQFTRITNLRVRVMGQDAQSTSLGDAGHIFVDTDNFTLSGTILSQNGSGGFRETFGSGFTAQNRLGRWTGYGLPLVGSRTKTGSVNCASGTSLDVRVFGVWIGVTGFLC